MGTYKVIKGQNIYDVAIAVFGSIEGLFDLMVCNSGLSLDTELQAGDVLAYDDDMVIYKDIVSELESIGITPANSERHVYHKGGEHTYRCYIQVSDDDYGVELMLSGDGTMYVDWGDNSDLEEIGLQSVTQTYSHYFDNVVESRVMKLYGDFNIKTWDLSSINGLVCPLTGITVDEVVSSSNNINLTGLLLFEGTYSVVLSGMDIDDLSPIYDMSLQELSLTDIDYGSDDVLDNYLIYIAENNNERRNCVVTLDTEPSGEYVEPEKDDNGNYVYAYGMEAIYVITHEEAWNEAGAWEFNINGTVYTYENDDVA